MAPRASAAEDSSFCNALREKAPQDCDVDADVAHKILNRDSRYSTLLAQSR